MPFQASNILDLLVLVVWSCLDNPSWKKSGFRHALQSKAFLVGLLAPAGLVLCPGLFDVVQDTGPPPLSWFEALDPSTPIGLWGVYAVVLRKDGCRPIIYIGSGTAARGGVRARFSCYDNLSVLPQHVLKALQDGYEISHRGLLVSCPIPSAARIPLLRTALIALEAAFSCIFSTMHNPDKHYGFYDLYPWPRSTHKFEYDGACSHNPLLESASANILLTPEQLESIAAAVKEKKRLDDIEYGRNQRANPTDEFRARQTRNNEKHRPNTKAMQQQAVATKQYYCPPCKVACRDASEFRRHKSSPRHEKKTVMGDDDYHCDLCNISFKYKSDYTRHCQSKNHKKNSST